MELVVRHQTTYRYDTPASQVALLLKLQPTQLDSQTLHTWDVTVNDVPVQAFKPNAIGDGEAFFQQRAAVDEIVILASGTAPMEELEENPWLQINALLPKPYSVAELVKTVDAVLLKPGGAY